jgi:transposase
MTNVVEALKSVTRSQAKLDAALVSRDAALRDAYEHGFSLRQLAKQTGIGVESVRRIVRADRDVTS